MLCSMFNSIPGLCLVDASNTISLSYDNQMFPDITKCVLGGGQNHSGENNCSN